MHGQLQAPLDLISKRRGPTQPRALQINFDSSTVEGHNLQYVGHGFGREKDFYDQKEGFNVRFKLTKR